MAARFCAACGAPVMDATDTFCGNCGSPLTRSAPPSTPLARPLSPSMPFARSAPPSMPLVPSTAPPSAPYGVPRVTAPPTTLTPVPGDPAFAAAMPRPIVSPSYLPSDASLETPSSSTPSTATTDASGSLKSAGLALLLEVLVPGAGVLYAGRVWRGIAWLASSLAGFLVAVIALDSMRPLRSSILGISYLAWIVVRCVLVSDVVEAHNAQARREPSPPLYSTGGAIGATVCAIVVALLLGSLVLYTQHPGSAAVPAIAFWGWAVVAAYWVALCRLPRAGALRVCVEVLGWNLLLFLIADMALLVLVRGALAARGISPLRARDLPIMQDLAVGRVALEVVVAGLLGYAFALTFARWPGVRARRIERGAAGAVALALLATGAVTLGYFVLLLSLAVRFATPRLAEIAALWAIGVPLVVWTALPAYAGWRALRLLRLLRVNAPAQPAAPPLASTPPPRPAYWPR